MRNTDTQKQHYNASARAAARAAVESMSVKPASQVEYRSSGRVAVIGGPEALAIAARLNASLQAQVILLHSTEQAGVPIVAVAERAIFIEGYLGAFKIILGEAGNENYQCIEVDLVLDLSPSPLLSMPITPFGYICTSTDESALQSAVQQLADLVGTFEKPCYFNYDASICAHGRAGQVACNRCIDACPADAITALAESIEVNAYLCQGGGVCATVCPSGAIEYAYPRAEDTLQRIRTLLRVYRENNGKDPVVAFFSAADSEAIAGLADVKKIPGNVIPVLVEELASVGLEILLATLAYGAATVLLVDGGVMPARVLAAVEKQLISASEILVAMGYAQNSICFVRPESLNADSNFKFGSSMVLNKPATFSAVGGKRQIAFVAIDYLYSQAVNPESVTNLTFGAAFGTANVNETRCTLCFACAGICPGHALQTGEDLPGLHFIESNCLQCGLCVSVCPEDAIQIAPRFQFECEIRNKPRVLYQEAPFCCVTCGKPFATQSVINRMLAKLDGHWMFQDEQAKRRLMMCEDCRVVDIVADQSALEQGFDSPPREH